MCAVVRKNTECVCWGDMAMLFGIPVSVCHPSLKAVVEGGRERERVYDFLNLVLEKKIH